VRAEVREEYERIQSTLFTLYEEHCSRHSSNVSRVGQALNGYYEGRVASARMEREYAASYFAARAARADAARDDESGGDDDDDDEHMYESAFVDDPRWLGGIKPYIDPRLSGFANMIVRDMLRLEETMYVSTAHEPLLLALYASNDAYRHAFSLHYNMLLSGKASTSKSFLLETLTHSKLPGTVSVFDRITNKSYDTDIDDNDTISVIHEIPKACSMRARARARVPPP
jgi:hypothetical protein